MRTACFPRGRILVLALIISSHLPLIGCSDDSRTSGTVVQVSEEAKQAVAGRKAAYKARSQALKDQAKDKSKDTKTR